MSGPQGTTDTDAKASSSGVATPRELLRQLALLRQPRTVDHPPHKLTGAVAHHDATLDASPAPSSGMASQGDSSALARVTPPRALPPLQTDADTRITKTALSTPNPVQTREREAGGVDDDSIVTPHPPTQRSTDRAPRPAESSPAPQLFIPTQDGSGTQSPTPPPHPSPHGRSGGPRPNRIDAVEIAEPIVGDTLSSDGGSLLLSRGGSTLVPSRVSTAPPQADIATDDGSFVKRTSKLLDDDCGVEVPDQPTESKEPRTRSSSESQSLRQENSTLAESAHSGDHPSDTILRENDSGMVVLLDGGPIPAPRAPSLFAATAPHGPPGNESPGDDSDGVAPADKGHEVVSAMAGSRPKALTGLTTAGKKQLRVTIQEPAALHDDDGTGNELSVFESGAPTPEPKNTRDVKHQNGNHGASEVIFERSIAQFERSHSVMTLSTRRRSVSQLFMLLRVYIMIKMYVRRWRQRRMEALHPDESGKKVDPRHIEVQQILADLDSTEWLHVFELDDVVFKGDHKGLTNVHISATHLYFTSQHCEFSTTLRLSDIVRILPGEHGLEFLVAPPQPNGQLGISPKAEIVGQLESVFLETQELSYIALHILDAQARILREYSARSLKTLRLKSKRTLQVVHFNDVYHLPPFKPANARGVVGGASRFHTVLAGIREQYNPLVLFSGDFMGPSLMSVITKGKQMIDAFNFLGVHFGCFGNHEFDFGLKTLKEVVHGYTQGKHIYPGSQTTWIMSNMTEADGSPLGGAQEFAVCTWNGIRVGLVGLCENWIPQCAYLKPNEAFYHDMYDAGEHLAQRLKQEHGAEIVIALTHNRLNLDREVMRRCPTIDYLLGGHDHFYKSDPRNRVLKSGQEFEYLSFVEFELGDAGINKVRIDTRPIMYETPQSDYMKGLIERYDAKMEEKLGKTIGMSAIPLDSTEECIRFREGHLTNFILDIMQDEAGADFAVLGAAAIAGKEVKEPGPVTIGDVFGWFPNDTKIMTMLLPGSTIRKMLDVMVRELPAEAPSFPHPSRALKFTINTILKPPRCRDIFIDGVELDDERQYRVAVEEFVGNGKAKYKFVPVEGEVLVGDEMAPQLVHWVIDYFVKRKGTVESAEKQERELALQTVSKAVSSSTRGEVDADYARSQKFVRSLMCQLLCCDRAKVILIDEDKDEMYFIPDGGSTEMLRFPRTAGLAGYVAKTNQPLNIPDVYQDSRFNPGIDKQTGYHTKSMLAFPVCLDGSKCVAVVQAINKEDDGVFDDIDELIARLLCEQVEFQLRNSQIYNEAKTEARALEHSKGASTSESHSEKTVRFGESSSLQAQPSGNLRTHNENTDSVRSASVGRGETPDDLLLGQNCVTVFKKFATDVRSEQTALIRSIMEHAGVLIEAEKILVLLQDAEASTPSYVTVTEDVEDDETTTKMAIEEGTRLEQVLMTGERFVENNARDAPVLQHQQDMNDLQLHNALLVPMTTATGDIVGAVCWLNKKDRFKSPFTDHDAFAAKYFGLFCAVAYRNTTRIEGLDNLRQKNNLQQLPDIALGRITIRGGWRTVRENLSLIAQWARDDGDDDDDDAENFLFVPDARLPSIAAGAEMMKKLASPSYGHVRQPSLGGAPPLELPGVRASMGTSSSATGVSMTGMSIEFAQRQQSVVPGMISKMLFEPPAQKKVRRLSTVAPSIGTVSVLSEATIDEPKPRRGGMDPEMLPTEPEGV